MMSPTGNRFEVSLPRAQRGFTLIEALVSVVILSAGLVLINQTLLRSLVISDFVNRRSVADQAAEKKIWEIKSAAWSQGTVPAAKEEGVLLEGKDTFPYEMKSVSVRGDRFLYEVRLKLEWLISGQEKSLKRTFYARLPHEAK